MNPKPDGKLEYVTSSFRPITVIKSEKNGRNGRKRNFSIRRRNEVTFPFRTNSLFYK